MKKIFDALKKYDTPITYGTVSLAFGLAFIFVPGRILDWLIAIAGVIVLALSMAKIAMLLENKTRFFEFRLIKDAAFALFGLTLIILRSSIASVVCNLLGIYMIVSSAIHIFMLMYSTHSERNAAWKADIILSVVIILLGIWLALFPLWPKILIGVAMILIGLELIGRYAKLKSNVQEKEDVYYTDDFVDKTDEKKN